MTTDGKGDVSEGDVPNAVELGGGDLIEKVPKPAILSVSPLATASSMVEETAVTAPPATALDREVPMAIRVDSSALLICPRLASLGIRAYHATDNDPVAYPQSCIRPAIAGGTLVVSDVVARGIPPR